MTSTPESFSYDQWQMADNAKDGWRERPYRKTQQRQEFVQTLGDLWREMWHDDRERLCDVMKWDTRVMGKQIEGKIKREYNITDKFKKSEPF